MTTTATGPRRVRPGVSKGRQAASRQIAQQTTTTAHKLPEMSEFGPEQVEKVILSERVFGEGQEPAFVRVSAGGTYSLQPYESLRIDVSVTLPCLPNEVKGAFDVASDLVANRLGEEEQLWLGARRNI